MKFVLAPDKYKGSLTGQEFCNAVESGLKKVFPDALAILDQVGNLDEAKTKSYQNLEQASYNLPIF